MFTSTTPTLLPRFAARRGTDGCDETFDIVCLATDRVVASLPFWDNPAPVKREATMLVAALNNFFDRGGCFFGKSLLKSIAANSKEQLID